MKDKLREVAKEIKKFIIKLIIAIILACIGGYLVYWIIASNADNITNAILMK